MAPQVVDVVAMFKEAAHEVSGKKLENVDRSTVISTLGMDSVTVMELVGFFEEKLSIRLPDEDLAKVQSVGDLCSLIEKLLPPGTKVAA